MPTHPNYEELRALIAAEGHKEHECRKYLQFVPRLLVKETIISLEYHETDYRGNTGDSDYVISAKIRKGAGVDAVIAYVWELKAPQCYIFKKETENRLCPSEDLVKAENQLLHYYDELRGSEHFRAQFRVTRQNDVRVGGIIIGCKAKQVEADFDNNKKTRLYEKALWAREHFYESKGLKLITWDIVLDFLRPPLSPKQTSAEPTSVEKDAAIMQLGDFSSIT